MVTDASLARHLMDRLGYGPRPGDIAQIQKEGADKWLDRQLAPASIPLPAALTTRLESLTTTKLGAAEAFVTYGPPSVRQPGDPPGRPNAEAAQAIARNGRFLAAEAIDARISRALLSPRQLEERMVEFWFNHFNVFVNKGLDRLWIAAYENEAIRPRVLGKFRDLLGATAKHPAMLFYLDNWQNTAPNSPGARGNFKGLNENYARELMELHTLGVNGGYGQDDVIALARILTGWGFGADGAGGGPQQRLGPLARRMLEQPDRLQRLARRARTFRFNPERHDPDDKTLLGHVVKGRAGESGIDEGEHALDLLARAPATAKHISFQLAQFFVADEPPPVLVDAMAKTFHDTDGDIRAVMKVLVKHPAFRDPATFGARFKTPYQYVISAVRAADVPVRNVKPLCGVLTQLGQPIYACQTPDGFKCTEAAWLSADSMTRRITFAVALGAGRLPLDADPDLRGLRLRQLQERPEPPMPVAAEAAVPIPAENVIAASGERFSRNTRAVVDEAPAPLKSGLLLGSPEFMRC